MTVSTSSSAPGNALAPDDLLAALQSPEVYPYAPERIDLVQTHISIVALAPPYVYKVKKPVDFDFLDFSTLAERRHFCQREVELNRRLCAPIYEGVVPISQTDAGLRLEDDSNVVEYAVKMKYLEHEHFLNQKSQRDQLTRADLDRVVDALTAFYAERDPTPEIAAAGRTARIKENTDENFEQTADHVGTLLSRPAFEAIRYATDRFYDQHALLLNRRRAHGHIVDAHGDLRLEHIHLTPEHACIYDCIEFNERFRHIDVANDIAFLAMDLDVHGHPDLARYVVRRMTDALDDPELPRLVDFYKNYRAFVRGKVKGLQSTEPEIPADERAESQRRARRFYQWALRYSVSGSRPLIIVVMGGVGTGKSTQANALGEALGWDVVSSDRVRKSIAGVPLYERADDATREQLYTTEMSRKTYGRLIDTAVEHGRNGRGLVLDATFSRRAYRDRLRERLAEAQIPHVFVELTADPGTLKQRLAAREGASDVVSDARLPDFEMLMARYEAPDALEDPFHIHASADADPEDTTTDILKHLVRLKRKPASEA
jgi:hypothetical protein